MSRVAASSPMALACWMVFLVLLPGVAAAQPSDPTQAARAAFNRGLGAAREERFAEAATAFEESYRLRPVPVVLFNLAGAYDRMGRVRQAVEYYNRYLREAGSTLAPERVTQVQANVVRLQQQLATVRLVLTPTTARVEVDGRDEPLSPEGLRLEAGEHAFSITALGFSPQRQLLTLQPGERRTLQVRLDAVATGEAPTATPAGHTQIDPRVRVSVPGEHGENSVVDRWWFWTGVGAVVVGGVVATLAAVGVFNTTAPPPQGVNYSVDALTAR